jgi:hypothetical protein
MTYEEKIIEIVVEGLKKVPAKRLALIELANTIPVRNGSFDPHEVNRLQKEIQLAITEAIAYGSGTMRMVESLLRLPPKGGDSA